MKKELITRLHRGFIAALAAAGEHARHPPRGR